MDLLGITSMYEPVSNSDLRQQMEVAELLKRLVVENGALAIMKCHDIASKYPTISSCLAEASSISSALPATSSSQRRDVYGVVAEVIVASIRSSRIPLFDVGAPHALGCLGSSVSACCTAIVQVRSLRQASMNPFDLLIRREDGESPPAEIIGDALVIDCRGCRVAPVPGTSECISCMVESMCRAGSADRVVLRTGRDMEISGKAGRILKEAASLRRWSIPAGTPPARCRGCAVSRREVMSRAWDRFPEPVEPSVKASLVRDVPARDGCADCASGTMKALEHMERGVESLMVSMKGGRRRSRACLSRSC